VAVAGVYRGRITRVTDGRVWVEVPRLVRYAELGPLPVVVDAGAGRDLATGDGVLLGLVEGRPDDLIVLGRTEGLPEPVTITELDPALYGASTPALILDTAGTGGVADTVARSDHRHELIADTPGTIAPDDTATEGASSAVSRADHRHAITAATPGSVVVGAAAEGVATSFARSDHAHGVASAVPTTIAPDDTADEGAATTLARSDHRHAIVAATPGSIVVGAAAEGAATSFARSDHAHGVASAVPGTIAPDDTAAEGSATSFARSDHRHAIVADTPGAIALADTAAEGSATSFARSDHRHSAPTAATVAAAVAALLVPPGLITPYGGTAAPTGWLLCDGASYATATYPALFTAIGYAYGGSGANFNVPNLKGRVPVGLDAADTDWDVLGETRGAKTHTLSVAEMPAHNHDFLLPGGGGSANLAGASGGNNSPVNVANTYAAIGNKGGGGAHNNLQPSLVVNYLIRT
jgi:microcystin-dependent protein